MTSMILKRKEKILHQVRLFILVCFIETVISFLTKFVKKRWNKIAYCFENFVSLIVSENVSATLILMKLNNCVSTLQSDWKWFGIESVQFIISKSLFRNGLEIKMEILDGRSLVPFCLLFSVLCRPGVWNSLYLR